MPHRVVFLVFAGFNVLDLTGPHQVFSSAPAVDGVPAYECLVATAAAATGSAHPLVASSGGIAVAVDGVPEQWPGPIGTLVAVGGPGVHEAAADERVVAALRAAAGRAERVVSVCTGAFLLARAGLLDGRRATTHWGSCGRLAAEHPAVRVERDALFTRDESGDTPVWTSAGVTAGMDLALALVEQDLGAEQARAIARRLVMFVQRPGGQSQFSVQLAAQQPARDAVRAAQAWIAEHPEGDLSVAALAARAGLSERQFFRVFADDVGRSPAAYVEASRVELARTLLESTDACLDVIAARCGFGTPGTLHRAFRRVLNTTPGQYRERFTRPERPAHL
ncbi:GlxA family transcriptional regulator [Kitasatospora sp. LaBMicrA B282]|uniref:GlxA family transcriptional regulator n=1 Tax=Kitasatospora sp. LaBMicrA B282 TaxID=3420949 RepID=UPI003D0A9D8A